MNFLEADVRRAAGGVIEVRLAGGSVLSIPAAAENLSRELRLSLAFRPQEAVLGEAGLPLAASHVEHLGSETIVHCRTAADETVVIAQHGQAAIRPGDTLHLDPRRTRFLLFDADGKRIAAQAARLPSTPSS